MKGRVLAGRFQLTEMLGQGGMGSVWRAKHLELGTDVAVKLMDPSLATNEEGVARFRREAQAAASLQSPYVVQVFDYGVDGDTPYIAMEMFTGESLASRIERLGRLAPLATAGVLSQVARALGKAHEAGIVHRDLKPENIFLVVDEDVEIAKVLDFGIAKRTGLDNKMTGAMNTQTGAMLGTPYYMSPEQAAGKKDVDHRTDIWSFGVIACECLIGRHFFDAETLGGLILAICTEAMPTPSALGPVPSHFDAWFACCVSRDKLARFQTIRDAAAALESVCRGTVELGASFSSLPTNSSGSAPALSSWPLRTNGSAGPAQANSTQAGPTSITVSPITAANRFPRAWLGIGAAALVSGIALVVWLRGSTPAASPASSAPPPSEAKPPLTVQPPTARPTSAVDAIPVVAASVLPMVDSSSPLATKAAAAKLGSPRGRQRPLAAAAPNGAAPKPAASPTPAAAARPPAHPNPVDLAF